MKDGYKLLALFDPHIQTRPNGRGGWKPDTAPSLETALRFAEWWKPDEILTGHDFMEFGPISYWNQRKRLDMEGRRLLHDYEYANQVLDRICAATRGGVTYQPGNHDAWMDDYVQEHPAMEGLLNQRSQLRLDQRGVSFVPYGGVYKVGKAAFAHELLRNRKTFTTKYHASRMAEDYSKSIFYGHHHTHQVYIRVTHDSKPNAAVAIGCLSDLNPGWKRNEINSWVNQFLFMEFDKQGHFTWTAPILINGRFYYNGLLFTPAGPVEANQ